MYKVTAATVTMKSELTTFITRRINEKTHTNKKKSSFESRQQNLKLKFCQRLIITKIHMSFHVVQLSMQGTYQTLQIKLAVLPLSTGNTSCGQKGAQTARKEQSLNPQSRHRSFKVLFSFTSF